MEKELLQKYITENLTQRAIAERENVSQATVKYWLNKYNLKTNAIKQRNIYLCKCGENNKDKFYPVVKGMCKICHNKYTIKRQKDSRNKAISYLGGKCVNCGYDKYTCSLDIHHIDPTLKDPSFKRMRGWKWERILKEISNCTILCRNCHSAYHAGELDIKI